MQFTVPKFIDKDPKIVGPFTFKEFAYLAVAVGASLILFFVLPLFLFFITTAILISGALSLIFLKPGGRSLPTILKNFFDFFIAPKMYLWKRKQLPLKVIEKKEVKDKKEEKESFGLKTAEKGLLEKLSTEIEMKTK